jgi:cobalt-zinc-cadmium efflux system protein
MHAHHHPEEGNHHHQTDIRGKKLLFVTLLNFFITIAEIAGGLLSNSLSLLSDAIHNLGDTLALFFAFVAEKIGRRKADTKRTFGYKRTEILTAFFNALILIIICLFLFKEAYERFFNPEPIKGVLMLVVAVIGLIANWVSVLMLNKDKKKNINIKAAYLHLLGDTLSSVAVIIGGLAILFFNIIWIDPLITVLVSAYIIYHTWGVLKESIEILMQSAPEGIDLESIKKSLEEIDEIDNVHHVHVWSLNESQLHFESHVEIKENINMEDLMVVRKKIENILHHKYEIGHTTIQFGYNCCDGPKELIVDENK